MATFTETFDTGDSDTLGPVLLWVEDQGDHDIVSNRARTIVAPSLARAPALDTANHYAQAHCRCDATTGGAPAVCIRKASSSTLDCYLAILIFASGNIRYGTLVAGALTTLGSDIPQTLLANTDYLLKMQAEGDTLSIYFEGVLQTTLSDSSHPTNLSTGIRGDFTTAEIVEFTDFQAGDITAATNLTPQIWM
jgi:hypothetical protein